LAGNWERSDSNRLKENTEKKKRRKGSRGEKRGPVTQEGEQTETFKGGGKKGQKRQMEWCLKFLTTRCITLDRGSHEIWGGELKRRPSRKLCLESERGKVLSLS